MSTTAIPPARSKAKGDEIIVAAVELARSAAEECAGDFGVGKYLGCFSEGVRVVTHSFACSHPGYVGWHWAVTMVRAARAKAATVSEVVLLPGEGSLLAPDWVPWEDRIEPTDLSPGTLLPTPDNDPRLEPGFSATDIPADMETVEASQIRAVANELGLGRERVMSIHGHDLAAERWLSGDGGPENPTSKHAPGECVECGYFVKLSGRLGNLFGVCANGNAPYDAQVVAVDHGCGAHSDVVEDSRGIELDDLRYDTVNFDDTIYPDY